MRQTRAAALLWAYDIGSKFGIAWRPRTILLMLGMVAVLGLVPTLALALWVGRLLNTIEVFVPWVSLATAWTVWTTVRVLVTQEREELTAPSLGPFMRAVDLSLGSWFGVRFAAPTLLEALYGCLLFSGLLWGVSATPETVVATFAMFLGGYVARLGLMAQLAIRDIGWRHLTFCLLLGALCVTAVALPWSQAGVPLTLLLLAIAVAAWRGLHRLAHTTSPAAMTTRRRRSRGCRLLALPAWAMTVVVLRRGTWVPPVRSMTIRLVVLCLLLAALAASIRFTIPWLNILLGHVTPILTNTMAVAGFLMSLPLGDMGVCWFGVRSCRRQLRAAWESGASLRHLALGSAMAHLVDGAVVTVGILALCAGLGCAPSLEALLLPTTTQLAGALGYAMFAAPELPDGRARTSLAGALAGVLLAAPGLVVALNPGFAHLAVLLPIVLFGGLAWMSMKVVENASFSIM